MLNNTAVQLPKQADLGTSMCACPMPAPSLRSEVGIVAAAAVIIVVQVAFVVVKLLVLQQLKERRQGTSTPTTSHLRGSRQRARAAERQKQAATISTMHFS